MKRYARGSFNSNGPAAGDVAWGSARAIVGPVMDSPGSRWPPPGLAIEQSPLPPPGVAQAEAGCFTLAEDMNMNQKRKALFLRAGPALTAAIALAAALALTAGLAGCDLLLPVSGSGRLTRSVYPAAGFSGIQASHSFVVKVVPDTVYSVTITCDDNLHRYLIVENGGPGTLRLGLEPGYNYNGVTLIAEVHMPVVVSIDVSGASTVNLDSGFSSGNGLTVVLSGASQCGLPNIVCGDASFDVSGASQVTCVGSAGALTIRVSGASRANVLNCTGTRASVNLSGASAAWVDVGTRPVDVAAGGASTFYYGGAPALGVSDFSGGSRMVRVR